MQKYRFDRTEAAKPNGSQPVYSLWMGGPSLAGVRNCPVNVAGCGARTVYVTGEPDAYFSVPAVARVYGFRVKGFLMADETGYCFYVQTEN